MLAWATQNAVLLRPRLDRRRRGAVGQHRGAAPRTAVRPVVGSHAAAHTHQGPGGMGVKTALVTGGASGIGRAIADRLRADGNHVATIDLHRIRHRLQLCRRRHRPRADRRRARAVRERARPDHHPGERRGHDRRSGGSPTSPSTEWSKVDRRQPQRRLPLSPRPCCPTCWTPAGAASSTSRRRAPTPVRRTKRPTSRPSPR